jgi:uncharacterized membrane protein YcaP (DUF421 family)
MAVVLLRTLIIYAFLIVAMRLMGKRQIGELEISDLVTTFLVSEIASLPITEPELPLTHALVPILTLLCLEVSISFLIARFPKLKHLVTARPSTLIKDGKLCQKAMKDSRISFDELFSELRSQGVDDISQISYAILEQSGKITVIQKARFRQPSAEDLHLTPKETGLFHIIIDNGYINRHGISQLNITEEALSRELASQGFKVSDIYLMMINDAGERKTVPKERKK